MTFSAPFRRLLPWLLSAWILAIPATAIPVITSFTPIFGPPGTQVTINGTGLRVGAANPAVFFGNLPASQIIFANQFQIRAVVPTDALIGPISVIAGGQATTRDNFFVPPRIDDFGTAFIENTSIFRKPVVATPGSVLTILGANFSWQGAPGLPVVRVGEVQLGASPSASSQILANIPPFLPTGYLSVLTAIGGTTNTTEYIYGAPRITEFTSKAAAGDTVNIKGFNFLVQNPAQLELSLGGVKIAAVEVLSNTNLIAVVPPTALTGPVSLKTPGGSFISLTNFVLLPKVAAFTPDRGGPGTVVTLNGSGLTGTSAVLFGGVAATTSLITNISANQVTAVVPTSVVTGPITLINAVGTNVTTTPFFGPPKINSFAPSSGFPGTLVTVNGLNLLGTISVRINGVAVPVFNVTDNTKLSLAVPADATSGRITVIGPGGTNESSATFTVQGPEPVISAFGPQFGLPGTNVTILGQNLESVTSVTFNGRAASYTIQSATALETVVPAGATTGKIRVTSPNGVAETSTDFVVSNEADLRVTFTANPSPAVAFGTVSFSLVVANNGAVPAANTEIVVELPTGMAFLEANGTAPFEVSGQVVTFSRGTLNPQALFTGTVKANAGSPTNRIVIARATSTTPEANPADNVRQINLVIAPPKLSTELLSPDEILLSWPASTGNLYIPQLAPRLSGPWIPAPGTPENDGSTITLTLPVTGEASYYRLQFN